MLAKIMITKKVVQCARERKLLVKEILKNLSIEIEGKTKRLFEFHGTYLILWSVQTLNFRVQLTPQAQLSLQETFGF